MSAPALRHPKLKKQHPTAKPMVAWYSGPLDTARRPKDSSFFVASVLVLLLAGAAPAADTCESLTAGRIQQALAGHELRDGLTAYLRGRLAAKRYFETDCTAERTDHPLYPGIPYRDCTYRELGLPGWVRLAVIPPDLVADWILNACGKTASPAECAVQLTAYSWCSNQLSFPIAGNIIEPGSSGGGSGEAGTNFIFLHGITITRPEWISANGSVDADVQRDKLAPLADRADAYQGGVAQVSRPSGIRREIYSKYATPFEALDVGTSCPPSARRREWLDVSRLAFVEGWRTRDHRLFDAAAMALAKGERALGTISCPAR